MKSERLYNVLLLCPGNSARPILGSLDQPSLQKHLDEIGKTGSALTREKASSA